MDSKWLASVLEYTANDLERYVNVYEVDRHYGGPEEGGWWYDSGECVSTTEVSGLSDRKIETLIAALEQLFPQTNEVGSVNYRSGDFRIYVESKEGASYPDEPPTYE